MGIWQWRWQNWDWEGESWCARHGNMDNVVYLYCIHAVQWWWCNVVSEVESAVLEDDTVEHVSALPQEVRWMCHVTPVLQLTVNNLLHYVHTLLVVDFLANDTWLMIYKFNLKFLTNVFYSAQRVQVHNVVLNVKVY